MPKEERIQVSCPRCHSNLVVDPNTGLVLHSDSKKSDYSFDEAVEKVKTRKEQTDELFQKAVQAEERRQESLEDKFREALDSQDELDEPIHPLELD